MKKLFILFQVLLVSCLSLNALAQNLLQRGSEKVDQSDFKNRIEPFEKNTKKHPLPERMVLQNHALQLKSTQTIKQRLDSTKFLEWNDTIKLWEAYSRNSYTYDAGDTNTQTISSVWVEATHAWIPDWKNEYSYNEKGNVIQYLGYVWDEASNQWIPDWKDEYTYNSDGTMPQILHYEWDNIAKKWVLSWQYLYTYDTNGKVSQIMDYYMDENTLQWVLAWKYVCTYDANNKLAQMLGYFIDENTTQWILDSNEEYIFDENGNNTKYIANTRNENTGQLELYFKREYTYDNSYSFNDLISPLPYIWQVNYFNHMLIGQNTSIWNKIVSEWDLPIYKANYFYSEQNTTSAKSINSNLFRIYPNPCSESVSFNFPDSYSQINFELFDMQGRKLISKIIGSTEKINMQGLESGMYLYKLNVDGKVQSGKLMKE